MANDAVKAVITHDPILVDLALQGGGSHGAFTWGVLDRLLEEPWLGQDASPLPTISNLGDSTQDVAQPDYREAI